MADFLDPDSEDDSLNVGGHRPRNESSVQPLEDFSQIERFARHYKNLLDRMNVNTHAVGDFFIPIAPDGFVPNSNLRANIYAWLYRRGMLDQAWQNELRQAQELDDEQDEEVAERMHGSSDYRHKLLKLISLLPTDITETPGNDENPVPGLKFQKRRMTRMHILSPKARDGLRRKVEQAKQRVVQSQELLRSRDTLMKSRKDLSEDDPMLPLYLQSALDKKILQEEQVKYI